MLKTRNKILILITFVFAFWHEYYTTSWLVAYNHKIRIVIYSAEVLKTQTVPPEHT